MRPRLGRPDLSRYADRFDAPVAGPDAPLSVTWMGVATLLLDDGSSALMTDGFFSRPSLRQLAVGKVAPSAARGRGGVHPGAPPLRPRDGLRSCRGPYRRPAGRG